MTLLYLVQWHFAPAIIYVIIKFMMFQYERVHIKGSGASDIESRHCCLVFLSVGWRVSYPLFLVRFAHVHVQIMLTMTDYVAGTAQ